MDRLNPDAPTSGFQTDVRRRTALSTSSNALRPLGAAPPSDADDLGSSTTSDEYLRGVEEEVNRGIDREVETLIEGMEEILSLASVRAPDKTLAMQESLSLSLRTETLIRSITSLLSLTHSVKMLWLLGDEAYVKEVRDRKREEVRREVEEVKGKVREEMERLGR